MTYSARTWPDLGRTEEAPLRSADDSRWVDQARVEGTNRALEHRIKTGQLALVHEQVTTDRRSNNLHVFKQQRSRYVSQWVRKWRRNVKLRARRSSSERTHGVTEAQLLRDNHQFTSTIQRLDFAHKIGRLRSKCEHVRALCASCISAPMCTDAWKMSVSVVKCYRFS